VSLLNFVVGDATCPNGEGAKVIVHICNDQGGWGKGFVLAVSKRWKEPETAYRNWHRQGGSPPFELGSVQFVKVEDQIWIANLIGQQGMGHANGKPPIRYEAVRRGLEEVAEFALKHHASVHMPRIGCGLAGGKWDEIQPIIEQTLIAQDIAVTVYDFAT